MNMLSLTQTQTIIVSLVAVIFVQYIIATFCLMRLATLDIPRKSYILWNLFILLVFFVGDIAFIVYYYKVKDKLTIRYDDMTENANDKGEEVESGVSEDGATDKTEVDEKFEDKTEDEKSETVAEEKTEPKEVAEEKTEPKEVAEEKGEDSTVESEKEVKEETVPETVETKDESAHPETEKKSAPKKRKSTK